MLLMRWSVRNTRVETELRGLRLAVVDEQARELLAGSGTVLCCCCCYSGCRTRQLIVTCRVGELAYRPQLAQPMTPPVAGPLQLWRLLSIWTGPVQTVPRFVWPPGLCLDCLTV